MSLFQKTLEKKLSSLIGGRVTFEAMNIALVGGSLDVHGVTISAGEGAPPVLMAKRVRAEIALTKALSGEIVVKSLTVERPVVSVVRRADRTTNLPRPPALARRGESEPRAE